MKRYAVLFILLAVTVGSRPQCDERFFDLTPVIINVQVDPGDCVELSFNKPDIAAVALCDTHAGLWMEVTRRPSATTFKLCAADDMPIIAESFELECISTSGLVQLYVVNLQVGNPMSVSATATPEVLTSGQTTQLDVEVSGGTPPFEYAWSYSESFVGRTDIKNPVARPTVGEVFSVRVSSSDGQREWASVLVDVVPTVTVLASPDTIDAGGTVNLMAAVTPQAIQVESLGWSWTPDLPSGQPLDPMSSSTAATPEVTTAYVYSVRTIPYGSVAADSAVVYVRP